MENETKNRSTDAPIPFGLSPAEASAWELTFEDDFDAPALDPTKWHAGYRLPGAKATPPRPAGPPRVAPGVTPKARL